MGEAAEQLEQNEIDPEVNEVPETEGKAIKPRSDEETKSHLRNLYKTIQEAKQQRREANEIIAAEREKAVTMGISRKAQAVVEAFAKLNEDDKRYFWDAVAVYGGSIGEHVQLGLTLVDPEG